MGWNVGQLMYTLLVNGFNIKNGNFIEYRGNVCAFVQKENKSIPKLNNDWWDIRTLYDAGLFPVKIITKDKRNDGFYGVIECINWKNEEY